MALQSSGAISLANVQTEFGGSAPTSISEYYAAASGVPASGTISLSDFYGTSAFTAPYLYGTGSVFTDVGLSTFGTIKSRMGATHFQMRTLKKVSTELALRSFIPRAMRTGLVTKRSSPTS